VLLLGGVARVHASTDDSDDARALIEIGIEQANVDDRRFCFLVFARDDLLGTGPGLGNGIRLRSRLVPQEERRQVQGQ